MADLGVAAEIGRIAGQRDEARKRVRGILIAGAIAWAVSLGSALWVATVNARSAERWRGLCIRMCEERHRWQPASADAIALTEELIEALEE